MGVWRRNLGGEREGRVEKFEVWVTWVTTSYVHLRRLGSR